MRTLFATILLFFLVAPAKADITGLARVIDGDTIEIAGERIRIHGIDAPELGQWCRNKRGKFPCGKQVKELVEGFLEGKEVTCRGEERDRSGRLIAVCFYPYGERTVDLGQDLVTYGWAMAYRKYSLDYIKEEARAREYGFGLWRGQFIVPWEWRRGKR